MHCRLFGFRTKMSGFCVRVLVLSLLTFGQHAKALTYRNGDYSNIRPYFNFPRSLKPAIASSSDESSGPSYTRGASSETLRPTAAPSVGGFSGQVDGYSPEGSVSSYRPGPPIIQKPRHNPQQPPQTNPNANGVLQTKKNMWDFPFLQNRNSFESGIVSSSGIEMLSYPELKRDSPWPAYPSKPQQPQQPQQPQRPAYASKPQQPQRPAYASKPQQPERPTYASKPQQPERPAYASKPQRPAYTSKPQRPAYPAKPQQPQRPAYPAKPQQPQQPQQPQRPAYASQPTYVSKPQRPAYPAKPQQSQQPQRPAYASQPQQPTYVSKPQRPAYLAQPQQPQQPERPAYPAKPQQPQQPERPAYPAKPQQPQRPQQPQQPQRPAYPAKPQQPAIQLKPQQRFPFLGGAAFGSYVQPTDSNPQMNVDPRSSRPIPMSSPYHPRWQQSLVPVPNRHY